MGSVYRRGHVWWFKYRDAAGEWVPEATKAATKARSLLHEIERRVERLGLEPLSTNPDGWTVADLMAWWLDTYSRHSPSHPRNVGSVRRHILSSPMASKRLEHVRPGDVPSQSPPASPAAATKLPLLSVRAPTSGTRPPAGRAGGLNIG